MLSDQIKKLAGEIHQQVIDDRRQLHAHPELSFKEYETARFVQSRLDALGIPWETKAVTGVVGIIRGEKPSQELIVLRADMDALPILEDTKLEFASRNPGVMHACGHDAHTASLLGTAAILQSLRQEFGGTIRLIFQPGEEKLPGGASLLIREGVLEGPKPQAVIGQHVMPSLESGKIGIRRGKFMASMDEILVTVHGQGGHGAQPHQNIDPVIIAAHILIALQQVVSRVANPAIPTVLSFGKLVADGAINVIPSTVYMEGTFRTMDESWRQRAHQQMKKIACGIAESMGGSCEFTINTGYPSLVNEEKLTDRVESLAREFAGDEHVVTNDIWMAAEDFAYYAQVADGCFYLLGTGNSKKATRSSLHTQTFNVDEQALALSTGLMAYIALRLLGN